MKIYIVVASWFDIDGLCSTNSYVAAFVTKEEAKAYVEKQKSGKYNSFDDFEIFDTEINLSPDIATPNANSVSNEKK